MPTLDAVLRILSPKVGKSSHERDERKGLTDYGRGRESAYIRRRTSKGSERKRDLADENVREGLLSAFRALAPNERIHSIPDTEPKQLDVVLRCIRVGYLALLGRRRARLEAVKRQLRHR
jgi:hypothetical protein